MPNKSQKIEPKLMAIYAVTAIVIMASVYIASKNPNAVLAIGAAMVVIGLAWLAFLINKKNSPSKQYQKQADDKVTQTKRLALDILAMARNIQNPQVKRSVIESCRAIPQILSLTKAKDETTLVSATTAISLHLESIKVVPGSASAVSSNARSNERPTGLSSGYSSRPTTSAVWAKPFAA